MLQLITIFLFNCVYLFNLTAENEPIISCIFQATQELDMIKKEGQLLKDLECSKRHDKPKIELPETPNIDLFESALSAECEPLATVGGCVNLISGSFFQIDRDLRGTTIDPLDFVRFYDSGSNAESLAPINILGRIIPQEAPQSEEMELLSQYLVGNINLLL